MRAVSAAKQEVRKIRDRRRLHPYTALLFSELALILLYPFLTQIGYHDELFRLLALIVFSTSLYAVMGRGRITTIAFVLGFPAIVVRLIRLFTHVPVFKMPDEFLGLAFLIFVTSALVWAILSNPSVTSDTLAGAVSAYLLIGITFGVAYMIINTLVPGSFRDTVEQGKRFTPADFTFFSFVTLTTVGYGDIVPWASHARSLAIIESVIGIMYPALLISRLVGMRNSKREES
ncbi:MAG: potassium channel family protein [Candidatus Korobacteraceae bacterium]